MSTGDLRAGIYPQAPEPPGPPSVRPGSFSEIEEQAQANGTIAVARAKTEIAAALRAADLAYQKTVDHQAAIATELASAQTAMQTTVAPDLPVLTDTVKRILSNNMSTLSILDEYARDDVEHAREARRELEDIGRLAEDAARRDPSGSFSVGTMDRANELAAASKLFVQDARTKEQKAKRIANGIVSFKPNPPIDGLLHSVQFVVTYGGSVSPTWTLLLWKGPGTPPGLSAQGVRTNSLNIALGPTTEQSRLITNQLISNIGTHP